MEFSPDNFLGGLNVTVLELILEQTDHQGTSHVQSFLSVVISVIFINLTQETIQEFLDHVPNKEGLLPEATFVHSDMGQNLFHKKSNGVLASSRNIGLFELVDMLANKS